MITEMINGTVRTISREFLIKAKVAIFSICLLMVNDESVWTSQSSFITHLYNTCFCEEPNVNNFHYLIFRIFKNVSYSWIITSSALFL